jgi:hypothetical protein
MTSIFLSAKNGSRIIRINRLDPAQPAPVRI